MKKAIAGVVILLSMFQTPGATPYAPVMVIVSLLSLLSLPSLDCKNLLGLGRSSGMFAHACCVTTRVTAGVGGGGLAFWLGFQK